MTKDELEAAINTASLWSGRSTLILALGILGEYVLLPFLEKKLWLRPAKIFFAILVVAGIAGEYEFSSRITRNSDRLQQISDQELADAITKAGDANKEAGDARKEAGKAIERASRNANEAATLRKRAEDDALARAKLEAAIAPRSVHLRLLVDRLKAFTGTSVVLRYLEDREPKRLAEQLNGAFLEAQWNVVPLKGRDVDFTLLYGVHISINEAWENGDVRILAAVNLAEELRKQPEIGAIFVPRIPFVENNPDVIIVEVGLQPERYFEERFFGPPGSADRRIPVVNLP